jgi:PAS domain S-box-containing protein
MNFDMFDRLNVGAAVFRADEMGRVFYITELSRAAERILGIKRAEAQGKDAGEVLAALGKEEVERSLREAWRTGQPQSMQPRVQEEGRATGRFDASVHVLSSGEHVAFFCQTGAQRTALASSGENEGLRLMAENMEEMFWLLDVDNFSVIFANPAFERLFRVAQDGFYPRAAGWLELVHPEDRERLYRALVDRSSAGLPLTLRVRLPDSTQRILAARAFPLIKAGGLSRQCAVIATDVTERIQAEEALKESEKKYRGLFDSSPVPLLELDLTEVKSALDVLVRSGTRDFTPYFSEHASELRRLLSLVKVKDMNRATLELFGSVPARDPAGAILGEDLSEDASRMIYMALAGGYEGRKDFEAVTRGRTAGGEILDIFVRISIMPGSEETWKRVFVSVIDISYLFRKERELLESETKFRTLTEQSQIGVCIIQDGRIEYANKAFIDVTGFQTGTQMGYGHTGKAGLAPGEDLIKAMAWLSREPEGFTEGVHFSAARIAGPDGGTRWFNIFLKSVSLRGKPAGMASLIDVTEEVEARQKAQERQRQLIQADKLASLGVLVAGVAHEISNPNQAITLSGQVVKDAWKDVGPILEGYYKENGDFTIAGTGYLQMKEMVPNCLSAILDCSKRIDTIVSDLKGFARQDQGEAFYVLDLNLVVKSSLTLLTNMLKKSTARLDVNLSPDLAPVQGNFQRLEQVIINLIQNACQALPDQSRGIFISTRAGEEPDTVVFEIRDEGTGIRTEDIHRITDPFFTTKRETGGTGLGLSISATIVGEHGGRMEHFSEPGAGTTARVILPSIAKKGDEPQ